MQIQTSPTAPLTCLLIGQDNLLIECAKLIQSNSLIISGIISPSDQIKNWTRSQAIPWFSSLSEIDWQTHSTDYLFSIVNNDLIPKTVLDKIRRLAINYHDGPLPRYAGSNATSWAILNNETSHAITWHVINEKVDAGDLLKQRTFPIDPADTALSLNLKCIEHALVTFSELINELTENTYHRTPQNLSQRTYFPRSKKPANSGWINWNSRADEIDRLCRATQFGQYQNPFSVAKVLVGNEVFAVDALTVLAELSDKSPGTLLEISHDYWKIATLTHVVKLSALTSLRGDSIQLDTLATQHKLTVAACLPLPDDTNTNLLRNLSEKSFSAESYWVEKLRTFQPTTATSRQTRLDLSQVPQSAYDKVFKFTQDKTEAPFVMLAAWLIYLRRIESKTQLNIYLQQKNAAMPEWLCAFFAPYLPLSVTIDDQQNFRQALHHIRQTYQQISQHGSYLIDCWRRYPELTELSRDEEYQITMGAVTPHPDEEKCALPTSFLTLLDELLTHAQQPIEEADWITPAERQQLLTDWNTTDAPYPEHKTIHQLFEEQVERTPDHIALIAPGVQLTYQELNQRANQLSHYLLKQYAIQPDQLVAVCLLRSEWMLIALLGILKSGAGYVPLDPGYPDNRLRFITNETNVKAIITTQDMAERIANLGVTDSDRISPLVLNDANFSTMLKQQPPENPITEVHGRHLAYVMYTSGTTGTPKGIQIEHRSIVNRIIWMSRAYPLNHSDRVLQKTPYVFDVSVWELFWANWTGATVVFAKPDGHRNLHYLAKLIRDEEISIIHFTPTMLNGFVQAIEGDSASLGQPKNQFRILRHLFCSGEVLHDATVTKARALMPQIRIHNLYGPTEAAIDVLYDECVENKPVCLGKPISNTRVYILDSQHHLLPPDMMGELYLAGDGLARGYLNQPTLTAQQFISNPFQTEQEKQEKRFDRLYKTGDLVRWLPGGDLDYIGRIDRQIKLRGNRIELDEIEQVIQRYPSITQCAVMVHSNQLVAYYTARQTVDEVDIRQHAAAWLPDYMTPNHWVCLDKLPTGISGKVDYKQLPHPVESKSGQFVPPRNATELTMAVAFGVVLGLEQSSISITDDFFKLGGDSILAIRLVSRINDLLNQRIQVRQVFELKTIQALSTLIEQAEPVPPQPETPYKPFSLVELSHYQDLLSQQDIEDIYPASRLQIGMLLESSLNDYGTYHDVFFYEINRPFMQEKFLTIWEALANKHALLRARFLLSEQHALDVVIFKQAQLHYRFHVDQPLWDLIDAERLVHFAHTEECLFHLIVNQHADNFELIFSFHHAIVDGWSVASLINEFVQAYAYDQPVIPAPNDQPTLTYGEFVRNEQHRLDDQDSIAFWKDYLEGSNPTQANWKFDDNATSPDSLFTCAFQLTPDEAKQAHQLARNNTISVDTVFLYAYLRTLSFFMNSDDITIGVVFNNRLEKVGGDTLFGLFLNVLPLRHQFDQDQNIPDALLATFANKIKLLAHKQIPFAQIKSLVRRDPYQFGYNFINFHVLNQSKSAIERRGGFDRTSIPFMLEVTQTDTFKVELKSHDSYISQDYLNYFGRYLKSALQNILNGKNELMLDARDYQKMIVDWNATARSYPKEKTLHQLFEEQVERTPNSVALVHKGTKLTYCELNQRANQLAHNLLIHHQIKPNDLVALFLDRDEWMVIAILGVLKSGAAYVPIEISYPGERIDFILSDTETKVVLTNKIRQKHLQNHKLRISVVNIVSESSRNHSREQSEANPISAVTSNDLAYVIYTSGTTGKPNGVMVEHRSVINTLNAMYPVYQCPKNKRATAYTSYVFDVSVAEMFTVLTAGSELHLLDKERNDVNQLSAYLLEHEINIAYLPPAILSILAKLTYPALKVLIFAGEPCSESVAKFWAINHELYNYYGPTEFTIYATGKRVDNKNINNIGTPIFNNQAFVLGRDRTPLPIGAIGELHLSGDGIVRGYFKNPELTEARFVEIVLDGHSEFVTKKLYKTGDLVRWLPSHELEYIGRNDSQVKINGYRIELSEIEHVLNNYPGMKQSVVMVQEHRFKHLPNLNANKYLVGYYLLDSTIQDDDQHNCIDNWKQLYESEYTDLNSQEYKDNIAGWKSSYTGEAFSKDEMREWKDEAIEKIRQLKPKRIIEIGSGTGMLLFNLINQCDHYFASELSEQAVQYISDVSLNLGCQDKVTLIRGDAKSLPFFSLKGKFETAILNSVIQYFPTVDYLNEVLNELIEHAKLPGKIFIGDVRDLRLLHCFKCSVLNSRPSPTRRRHEIDYFVSCEKELLVAPDYFLNLKKKDRRISQVELLPKLSAFSNEMNDYRYDVVLHIGNDSAQSLDIDIKQFIDLKDLVPYLTKEPSDLIAIRYPNKRILKDYKEYSQIYNVPFEFSDQDIEDILPLDQVTTMLRQHGYDSRSYLSLSSAYALDIVAFRPEKTGNVRIKLVGDVETTPDCTNSQFLNAKLIHDKNDVAIRNYVKTKLPDYMIPSYLFPLAKLSTTPSGKLDRTALPNPELLITETYFAPRNKLEIDISQLFSKILGLPLNTIGIKSSFFEMGGNSLSAIVLASKLNRYFSIDLKIGDIFKHKNIESLSEFIFSQKGETSRQDVLDQ